MSFHRVTAEYDIIISGAGPAGATLARLLPGLLGDKLSILLLEARHFAASAGDCAVREMGVPAQNAKEKIVRSANVPTVGGQPSTAADNFSAFRSDKPLHGKCCGGLLAPDAQTWLHKLGLELPGRVLDAWQPKTVWTMDLESGHERSYARPYINMDRLAFEQWLLSLLPESVDFQPGQRLRSFKPLPSGPGNGGLTVSVEGAQGGRLVRGRVLVGADGAFSSVRGQLGMGAPESSLYLAVQDCYAMPLADSEILTGQHLAAFDSRLTDFYGWGIPKAGGYLLGLALPMRQRADNLRRMERFVGAMRAKGLPLGQRLRRQGTYLLRPGLRDICLGKAPVFLLGEAAGWISPSSAEGFSYAFASAQALAQALASNWKHGANKAQGFLPGVARQYYAGTLSLRANIAWKLVKSQVMHTTALRRAALVLGLDG